MLRHGAREVKALLQFTSFEDLHGFWSSKWPGPDFWSGANGLGMSYHSRFCYLWKLWVALQRHLLNVRGSPSGVGVKPSSKVAMNRTPRTCASSCQGHVLPGSKPSELEEDEHTCSNTNREIQRPRAGVSQRGGVYAGVELPLNNKVAEGAKEEKATLQNRKEDETRVKAFPLLLLLRLWYSCQWGRRDMQVLLVLSFTCDTSKYIL